eukprot:COSAG01_NODE_843_length_13172_cov_84.009791_14_plen_100_part_00
METDLGMERALLIDLEEELEKAEEAEERAAEEAEEREGRWKAAHHVDLFVFANLANFVARHIIDLRCYVVCSQLILSFGRQICSHSANHRVINLIIVAT